jgi:ABC-type multidrug transport system ATPase subunit
MSLSFQNLCVSGVGSHLDYQKTFANYPLMYLDRLMRFFRRVQKTRIQILHDIEGLVKSGEVLIVLGRPGSGCSTLLKTLAGQTHSFHVDAKSQINYQGQFNATSQLK